MILPHLKKVNTCASTEIIVDDCWWFAYDVIKIVTMQIITNLLQIFILNIRLYNVSLCAKFKSIWTNENRVIGQRIWRIYVNCVIWKNALAGIVLPTNMAATV